VGKRAKWSGPDPPPNCGPRETVGVELSQKNAGAETRVGWRETAPAGKNAKKQRSVRKGGPEGRGNRRARREGLRQERPKKTRAAGKSKCNGGWPRQGSEPGENYADPKGSRDSTQGEAIAGEVRPGGGAGAGEGNMGEQGAMQGGQDHRSKRRKTRGSGERGAQRARERKEAGCGREGQGKIEPVKRVKTRLRARGMGVESQESDQSNKCRGPRSLPGQRRPATGLRGQTVRVSRRPCRSQRRAKVPGGQEGEG